MIIIIIMIEIMCINIHIYIYIYIHVAEVTITQIDMIGIIKEVIHFSICARHPCAGAMLRFSVSFQY